MSVSREASATPFTTSSGAKSPPIASTAMIGIRQNRLSTFRSARSRGHPSAAFCNQALAELVFDDTVLEGLAAVDKEHRNLRTELRFEIGISGDVDLRHR